jgi:Ca2+-binding EF-hand superfamily protein
MDALEARAMNASAGGGDEGGEGMRMSNDELLERVTYLFNAADVDGNGYLDRQEFKSVFESLKTELGLSNKAIKQIMAEADENDDGVIEYAEFVPIACDVINMLEAKKDLEVQRELEKADAVDDAKDFLLHGMPREQLEEMLKSAFIKSDADKSGYLDRKEFKQCLKGSGLGFTKKEINVMLTEVDLDGDGRVTYQEFVPLALNMLSEMMADKMRDREMAAGSEYEDEIRIYLEEIFAPLVQEAGTYTITKNQAVEGLRNADLGLTRIQIAGVMSTVTVDKHSNLDYMELVKAASGVIVSLGNVEHQRMLADQVESMKQNEDYGRVLGYTQDDMRGVLDGAFRDADAEGSGLLPIDQVAEVVASALQGIDESQFNAVMSLAAVDDDGNVWYDDVSDWAYHTLEYIVSGQHAVLSPR